jgi:hypothetical protein
MPRSGGHVAAGIARRLPSFRTVVSWLNIDGPNRSREERRAIAKGNPQA